jgi:hypothetical protein
MPARKSARTGSAPGKFPDAQIIAAHISSLASSLSVPNVDAVSPNPSPILLMQAATVANEVNRS